MGTPGAAQRRLCPGGSTPRDGGRWPHKFQAAGPARSVRAGPQQPARPALLRAAARGRALRAPLPTSARPRVVDSTKTAPRPQTRGAGEGRAQSARTPRKKTRPPRLNVRDGLQDELRHHPSSDQRPAWPPPRPRLGIQLPGACDPRPAT